MVLKISRGEVAWKYAQQSTEKPAWLRQTLRIMADCHPSRGMNALLKCAPGVVGVQQFRPISAVLDLASVTMVTAKNRRQLPDLG
jgi:hypothetical protein